MRTSWRADETAVTGASGLDIDHMVPLAEAWDSGASAWTAARREAYANDLGQASSLVAVTARSNRSKSDQDPAEWLPPTAGALCRYGAEWTATKLRWGLTVDDIEKDRLLDIAAGCREPAFQCLNAVRTHPALDSSATGSAETATPMGSMVGAAATTVSSAAAGADRGSRAARATVAASRIREIITGRGVAATAHRVDGR